MIKLVNLMPTTLSSRSFATCISLTTLSEWQPNFKPNGHCAFVSSGGKILKINLLNTKRMIPTELYYTRNYREIQPSTESNMYG